jgi:hypothetical protein
MQLVLDDQVGRRQERMRLKSNNSSRIEWVDMCLSVVRELRQNQQFQISGL